MARTGFLSLNGTDKDVALYDGTSLFHDSFKTATRTAAGYPLNRIAKIGSNYVGLIHVSYTSHPMYSASSPKIKLIDTLSDPPMEREYRFARRAVYTVATRYIDTASSGSSLLFPARTILCYVRAFVFATGSCGGGGGGGGGAGCHAPVFSIFAGAGGGGGGSGGHGSIGFWKNISIPAAIDASGGAVIWHYKVGASAGTGGAGGAGGIYDGAAPGDGQTVSPTWGSSTSSDMSITAGGFSWIPSTSGSFGGSVGGGGGTGNVSSFLQQPGGDNGNWRVFEYPMLNILSHTYPRGGLSQSGGIGVGGAGGGPLNAPSPYDLDFSLAYASTTVPKTYTLPIGGIGGTGGKGADSILSSGDNGTSGAAGEDGKPGYAAIIVDGWE